MANPTFVPIETQTLTGSTTSVTIGSGGTIPQTYTDLFLVIKMSRNLSNAGDRDIYIRFNGDTGNNYSRTRGYQTGTDRNTNQSSMQLAGSGDLASSRVMSRMHIKNYTNSNTAKTVLSRWGRAGVNGQVFFGVGTWRATPQAITSITIFENVDGFAAGDSLTLYGIKAA